MTVFHSADLVVRLSEEITLNDVDQNLLKQFGGVVEKYDDKEKAQRILVAQMLIEGLMSAESFDRIEVVPEIYRYIKLGSGGSAIYNEFLGTHTKVTACYGVISKKHPTRIISVGSDPERKRTRGLYLQIWNNNVPTIDESIIRRCAEQVVGVVKKYPRFTEIIYYTNC